MQRMHAQPSTHSTRWLGGSVPADIIHAAILNDEICYRVFRVFESRPEISQRELASELGASLGKTNHCVQAMLKNGWIRVGTFKNRRNKIAYSYMLTPEGIERKARIASRFLKRKAAELEAMTRELEQLRKELAELKPDEIATEADRERY